MDCWHVVGSHWLLQCRVQEGREVAVWVSDGRHVFTEVLREEPLWQRHRACNPGIQLKAGSTLVQLLTMALNPQHDQHRSLMCEARSPDRVLVSATASAHRKVAILVHWEARCERRSSETLYQELVRPLLALATLAVRWAMMPACLPTPACAVALLGGKCTHGLGGICSTGYPRWARCNRPRAGGHAV
jgi:hypothetical protein